MDHSRQRILERLRLAQGAPNPLPDTSSFETPVRAFDWDAQERLSRFVWALEAVRGEVHLVGNDWPSTLFALLRGRGVGSMLYGPGGLHGTALERGWPDPAAIGLMPYRNPCGGLEGLPLRPGPSGL